MSLPLDRVESSAQFAKMRKIVGGVVGLDIGRYLVESWSVESLSERRFSTPNAGRALPVFETFASFQGEGCHLGCSAYFIRLFGCPVHCPWCDSAGTWHPDHVPERVPRRLPEDLAAEAAAERPQFVVITGGEPAIHDLEPLTAALREVGLSAHLETSGAFSLRGAFAWVTLSPKRWKPPLPEVIARADEFKLIIDEPAELERWRAVIPENADGPPIWLHPEWSLHEDRATLAGIAKAVRERGSPYRAGWQVHKAYGVR